MKRRHLWEMMMVMFMILLLSGCKGNGVSGCAAPDRKRGYHIMKERIKTILLLLGILAGIAYVLMVPVGCLLYAIVNGGFM